jgi:TM2 domain-containing membrane protein YozV
MNRKLLHAIAYFIIVLMITPVSSFSAERASSAKSRTSKASELKALEAIEYQRAFFERKRDPILAGILSWYVPGLGQFYSDEIAKGAFFLITEYTLTLSAILYFVNFDFSAGGKSGFKINIDAKRSDLGVVETPRKNVFIGIMSLVALIHLYNISDAVQSARIFNLNLETERKRLRDTYPFIFTNSDEKRSVYFGLQTHF